VTAWDFVVLQADLDPRDVLYEDNHCLVVVKPAGLLTVADATGDDTLAARARRYLAAKYHKPGRVFLGIVHRLDRPVSGIVLFARTSKSAARLSEQMRGRSITKEYAALVSGRPHDGSYADWLLKDERQNVTRIVAADAPGARLARLELRVEQRFRRGARVFVRIETGRSHQIRVQLAARGTPICGDRKYGSPIGCGGRLTLHAARLRFQHPTRPEEVDIRCEPPVWWYNVQYRLEG
jgi:23S rRNA pseudouridine1911/1915/1917 synthase